MRNVLSLLAAFALLALAGCASITSLQPEDATPGNVLQVKGKSYDDVWSAALKAVRSRGDLLLDIADKGNGTIRAEKPADIGVLGGSYGYNVAVFVTPSQPGVQVYTVKVASMQKAGPFGFTDYAPSIVTSIKLDLGIQ